MHLIEILPWAAAAAFVIFSIGYIGRGAAPTNSGDAWRLPAALSILFLAFSLSAVLFEDPIGFWKEHTRSLWGNQIWFDLLLAVGLGFVLLAPRARALGMNLWLWLGLILCSGMIGLLAMFSRVLYLEARKA